MGVEVRELKLKLLFDNKGAIKGVQQLDKSVKNNQKTISDSSKKSTNAIDKIQSSYLALAAGVAASVLTLKKFTSAALQQAQATDKLRAIAKHTGNQFSDVNKVVQSLTKDGMLSYHEAAMAVSNLLSTGLNLDKTNELLRVAKDNAVTNRQAHYELGQSIVVFTEGIRNQNSMLTDSVGITKNYAAILKDEAKAHGLNTNELTKEQQALLIANGFIKEGAAFLGQAADKADKYQGVQAKLNTTINQTIAALGTELLPLLTPILKAVNSLLNGVSSFPPFLKLITAAIIILIPLVAVLAYNFGLLTGGITLLSGLVVTLGLKLITYKKKQEDATKSTDNLKKSTIDLTQSMGKLNKVELAQSRLKRLEELKNKYFDIETALKKGDKVSQEHIKTLRLLEQYTQRRLMMNGKYIASNNTERGVIDKLIQLIKQQKEEIGKLTEEQKKSNKTTKESSEANKEAGEKIKQLTDLKTQLIEQSKATGENDLMAAEKTIESIDLVLGKKEELKLKEEEIIALNDLKMQKETETQEYLDELNMTAYENKMSDIDNEIERLEEYYEYRKQKGLETADVEEAIENKKKEKAKETEAVVIGIAQKIATVTQAVTSEISGFLDAQQTRRLKTIEANTNKEKELLKQKYEDGKLGEQEYQNRLIEIDNNAERQTAKQEYEYAKSAKNMKIAEATIAVIQGAINAYTSVGGGAVGAALAAAVLYFGFAKIKEMADTPIPKPVGLKEGGKLEGYGGGDKIPALLEPGEFVIRKEAVALYGAGLLNNLNALRMQSGGIVNNSNSNTVNNQGGNSYNFTLNGMNDPIRFVNTLKKQYGIEVFS